MDSGYTVIGWADGSLPKMTEVRPDGASVYELDSAYPAHCYRVFRLPWMGKAAVPYLVVETHPDRTTLLMNKFEDESVARFRIYAGTSPHPTTVLDSSL